MFDLRFLRQLRCTSLRWSAKVQARKRHSRSSSSSRRTRSTTPNQNLYSLHRSTSPASLDMSPLPRTLRLPPWPSHPCRLTIRHHGSPQHRLLASQPWRLSTLNTPHRSLHLLRLSTSLLSQAMPRRHVLCPRPPWAFLPSLATPPSLALHPRLCSIFRLCRVMRLSQELCLLHSSICRVFLVI